MSEPEKNESGASRARKEPKISVALTKIVKKAAQIADLMDGADVAADLKVLRQAKKATHHIYDTKKKKLVKVPDHKTRLAATTLSRAYHEGRPIERSMVAIGDFKDLRDELNEMKASPEALRLLQALTGGQIPILQEPGLGKQADATREIDQ